MCVVAYERRVCFTRLLFQACKAIFLCAVEVSLSCVFNGRSKVT